jgi:hypothetical protein
MKTGQSQLKTTYQARRKMNAALQIIVLQIIVLQIIVLQIIGVGG